MKWLLFIGASIVSILVGITLVVLVVRFLPRVSPEIDEVVLTPLGVSRPIIIGFLPFWLLDAADNPYEKYLTNVTYFGLGINADGSLQKMVNEQEEEPGWTTLKTDRLKEKLKTAKSHKLSSSLLIHQSDPDRILELLSDPEGHAATFVSEVAPVLSEHKFRDLNLDIELFSDVGVATRSAMTAFLRSIRQELSRKAPETTLTVEITPISLVKPHLLDPAAVGDIANHVVLMAYDYHYSGSFVAGPVAPLGGAGTIAEYDVEKAVGEAVRFIPRRKIILGIPLYGYQWETLGNASGLPTIPGSSATASNRRVAEMLATCSECAKGYDEVAKSPYLIYPDGEVFKQTYYEDAASLAEKVKLAKDYNLGGVALWALGYESADMLVPLGEYKQSVHAL